MKILLIRFLFALLTVLAIPTDRASAEIFKLAILHGNLDIFDYEIGVIRLALEQADGDHELQVIPMPGVTQTRVLKILEYRDDINVFFTGYSKEREETFLQVDVPLTRGLLGHRVFIRKAGPSPLNDVKTIQQLSKFIIGSGEGWPDTDIFEAAGFQVAKSTYDNLWPMLDKERYDLFNRGLNEAATEIRQQNANGYNFAVDRNLLVTYPFDYFIYLNKKSSRLHEILTEGLDRAYKNGSFQRFFFSHPNIRAALTQFPLKKMTALEIDNPYLSDRIRNLPSRYWYSIDRAEEEAGFE
ncbi:hypothetical protein GUA87_03690 [Sneathiella sp. P13V-1]|uniref:hypothetical protein n=1 Tax=Sneathiella sp. P13V-1 TaxID=2697366 RepID=UPI00187BA9B8|nr:hypothetical protein [Sneathiella sp. P13V-1]MBE7635932.1 hypothetical protein [Sneathiella sp. P13V-1]